MIHKPDLAHVAHAIALAGAIFVQGPLPVFGQESALSRCTVAMGAIAPDERIKACSLALQSASPSSAAIVHNFRAVAWHDKYDLDRAIADYGDAVRLNPNYANAFNNRGIAWQAKGDLDRAIADHSQAIRADPGDNSGAYRFRSIAWRLKGEHDRAIADASEAIRLYPDYTAAYVARGLAYEEKRDIARARADYVQALAQPAKYPSGPQAHRDATQYLAALDSRSAVSIREGVTGPTFKRRVALVIGNSQYAWNAALSNPINDATDMAAALRKLGFDVVERKNIGRRDMDLAIGEFSRKLDGADLALFFYAGHGLQVNGTNYMVPIDAKLEQADSLAVELVDLGAVLTRMESAKRVSLIFLDACRDNPLGRKLALSSNNQSVAPGPGLAARQGKSGTMIAFATQPDNVALDGEGRNSPFTTALLRHIPSRSLDIGFVMRRVRAQVIALTLERQVPWDHSSLLDEVVLAR